MSKNKPKNQGPRGTKVVQEMQPNKVKMTFTERKYYNDMDTPFFEPDKVYELEGADWIQRWLKRGGTIVQGELTFPKPEEPSLSTVTETPDTPPQTPPVDDNSGEGEEDKPGKDNQ